MLGVATAVVRETKKRRCSRSPGESHGEQSLLVTRGDREVDERRAEDLARGQIDDLNAAGVLLAHEQGPCRQGRVEERTGEALGDELGGEVRLGREGGASAVRARRVFFTGFPGSPGCTE